MVTSKTVAAKLATAPTGDNSANGKSEIANPKKEEVNDSAPAEKLPLIVNPKTEDVSKPSTSTLEEKFYKMDVLFSHREKWEKLKESADKLNKFKLATDGRTDHIVLKDAAGVTFSTYSPDVFSKVLNWLKEDLSEKLKEVESQIIL